MNCLNGFLHSISKRQWLCALSRLQCSQERDAIESNRQVVIVSWWSVLIKSSIYTICRLWKHIKASRWAVSREGELNEDWVKREHTIYRGGHKPAYTIRILFFQQISQYRCFRSKDCVEKFIGHIKPETKMLYETAHTQSSPWFHLSRQYIALHDKQGYFLW